MMKLFKGWFKIYLFYGVVFFLLGLLGSLASDQDRLTAWFDRQKEKVALAWSQYITPENGGPFVPAFANHSGKVIIQIYQAGEPPQSNSMAFESMLQDLQNQLREHFQQVMMMPVEDFHTLSLESSSVSTSLILIGFKRSPEISKSVSVIRNQFYFGMSDSVSSLLAGKLTQTLGGQLPVYSLNKRIDMQNTIYELDWDEDSSTKESASLDNEVFLRFMKIMNQDIIPLMGKTKLE
jgi:hypothetical protein